MKEINKMKKHKDCDCGNPENGFPCICDFLDQYPGDTEYSCEYCGIYSASRARCNHCEAEPPVNQINNK